MSSVSCRVASIAVVALVLASSSPAQEARDSLSRATRDLAQRVGPAIVALESARTRMFGQARGTGFFVSEEGHIVTDLDLVGDRRRVGLRLANGVRGRARVVGRDPLNGIALLQLEESEQVAPRLPGGRISWLTWGESSGLDPAESVFSVGNAFDSLAVDGVPAFSRGVVSRVGRLRENGYSGVVIETDAAVNPGVYGGPLLDREGRVVGVLSEAFSARRFLGVAIPADQVRLSVAALRAGRPPARGLLGVFVRASGGEAHQGLEVIKVAPGSPAAKAGVKAGDRLVEIDGLHLHDENDLAGEMERLPPGAALALRLRRGQAEQRIKLVLGEGEPLVVAEAPRPEPQPRPQPQQPQPQPQPQERPAAARPALGVQVREHEGPGLSVVGVESKGPAELAGIKAGDTMLMFDGRPLDGMDALREALSAKAPGDLVQVRIERDGWRQDVKVRLGSAAVAAAPPPSSGSGGPGWLGVTLRPEGTHPGALVEGVEAGSPAAQAGLVEGDLIVRADGNPVSSTPDLIAVLKKKQAGEAIKLHVIGPKGERNVVATLAARPGTQAPAPTPRPTPRPTPAPAAPRPWLGVSLVEQGGGLLVDEVDPRGPVAKLGLKKGDQLQAVDGKRLGSLDQLAGLLEGRKPGQKLKVVVVRDGWEKEFQLELGTAPR